MWQNFKSMPLILKFLTIHALACIAFLIFSIIPHDSFIINGENVTYSKWWGSGVGVYASMLGTLTAVAGYLLVTKKKYSRQIYLGILSLALIAPYLKFGEYYSALFGVSIVLMISAYLFLKASVKEYFAPNKALQSDAAKPRR